MDNTSAPLQQYLKNCKVLADLPEFPNNLLPSIVALHRGPDQPVREKLSRKEHADAAKIASFQVSMIIAQTAARKALEDWEKCQIDLPDDPCCDADHDASEAEDSKPTQGQVQGENADLIVGGDQDRKTLVPRPTTRSAHRNQALDTLSETGDDPFLEKILDNKWGIQEHLEYRRVMVYIEN